MFESDIVIGLEIHAELATETKLFCSCPTHGSDEPNTRTCDICLGHPGSKPVVNRKAMEFALKLCLALGSKISQTLIFSRKSYFYPDMSKNYQITQYEEPIGTGGSLKLSDGTSIGLVRVHMEEDPASLVHQGSMQESKFVLIDYNRSGDPLVEIVTEPELTSPDQARDFMKQLIAVLNYLGIFDVNRCIIKADANVSIKESGYIKAEIKNITGFKEIERALNYEVQRQKKDVSEGKKIVMETRGWDSDKGLTFSMRTKESEDDYGYILDPDLVRINITDDLIKKIEKDMPELAQEKAQRLVTEYNISKDDAVVLSTNPKLADMFERCAKKFDPKTALTWCRREISRVLNFNKLDFKDSPMTEEQFLELVDLIHSKKITENVGQKILNKLILKPFSPKEYVEKENLSAVSDTSELNKVCDEVVSENEKAATEYRAGNEKSLHFLVGQVMKKTKGKASPKEVNELLKKILD